MESSQHEYPFVLYLLFGENYLYFIQIYRISCDVRSSLSLFSFWSVQSMTDDRATTPSHHQRNIQWDSCKKVSFKNLFFKCQELFGLKKIIKSIKMIIRMLTLLILMTSKAVDLLPCVWQNHIVYRGFCLFISTTKSSKKTVGGSDISNISN